MIGLRFYKRPEIEVVESVMENGFCVSIEFTPGVEGSMNNTAFGADDMVRTVDTEEW